MNIRSITIVATLFFSSLISLTSAQLPTQQPTQRTIDLPDALEVERQARNDAYKQRLQDSKTKRRQNLRANSAARQRSTARRQRLASRIEPKAPPVFDPLSPSYTRLLNGEQIETLNGTYLRGLRGSSGNRVLNGYVAFPTGSGVLGAPLTR